MTKLGSGWSEAGDGCGGQLGQGGVALGEVLGHGQHVAVSVRVEADDAPLLQVAQDASASDLKGVGHVRGREARQRAELGRAIWDGNVHTIQEQRMEVGIELQVGRSALHGHDRPALHPLAWAGAQAALVPGAVFALSFPDSKLSLIMPSRKSDRSPQEADARERGRVLVVDDESVVAHTP